MKHYIYWPNGVLEIRIDGKIIFSGQPVKGEALYGKPGPSDKAEYISGRLKGKANASQT